MSSSGPGLVLSRILHVTDIHCSYDNVSKLKQWLQDTKQSIDLVFISGDIANVPLEEYRTGSQELLKKHEQHLKNITESFLSISSRVYYIPGNHDTLSSFSDKPEATDKGPEFPKNVHIKSVRIAPNLTVLGLGGSIPSFTPEGHPVWEGFPYDSDEKYGKDVGQLLDAVVADETTPPKETYILMTHSGPSKSSTSEVWSSSSPTILGGSEVLHSYLLKDKLQRHCLLNIHGHNHPSTGMATVGQISVVNPGALVEGHFGIYCLENVSGANPSWKIRSISLHRLQGT